MNKFEKRKRGKHNKRDHDFERKKCKKSAP